MLSILRTLKSYVCIVLGSGILAFGLTQFLAPLKLSSGGVSTISIIMLYVFKVPLSITTLVVNAALFAVGFKFLEKSSLVKTVVGVVSLSAALEICSHFPTYSEDIFVAMAFGGVICGIGIGMVVREGASTGGSDFAALMIHRLVPHVSVATVMIVIDCAIVAVSGIIFRSLTITVYSMIALCIAGKITDMISLWGNDAKFAFIISPRYKEISDEIIDRFDRGVTGIYCKGMYSSGDTTMLLCVVNPREMPKLIAMVKSYDKNSFVVVSDAKEVLGEGFKEI